MSEIGDDLLISLISRAAVNLYLSSNKELLMFPRTSCQRCLNFSLKNAISGHFRPPEVMFWFFYCQNG